MSSCYNNGPLFTRFVVLRFSLNQTSHHKWPLTTQLPTPPALDHAEATPLRSLGWRPGSLASNRRDLNLGTLKSADKPWARNALDPIFGGWLVSRFRETAEWKSQSQELQKYSYVFHYWTAATVSQVDLTTMINCMDWVGS